MYAFSKVDVHEWKHQNVGPADPLVHMLRTIFVMDAAMVCSTLPITVMRSITLLLPG